MTDETTDETGELRALSFGATLAFLEAADAPLYSLSRARLG